MSGTNFASIHFLSIDNEEATNAQPKRYITCKINEER